MNCKQCKIGEMLDKEVCFKASFVPFDTPKLVNIKTIACNSCDNFIINQEHVNNLRKKLK